MKINDAIDLNELLPALLKYRRLYWENREHELKGYLLDHDLRERGASDDEVDDAFDAHHGRPTVRNPKPTTKDMMEHGWELTRAEADVMRVLRGAQPPEVDALQQEVIDKVGE